MSREVIQDFLNLAGIVGIALTNRRMRPYFYGLDTVLERTKQALGQGVLQVVENVPEGFESFEFHFASHVVFIYKLTHGLVLLVLTDSDLKNTDYRRGITKIKYLIETDTYNTVAYFKLLLGTVTQHSLPNASRDANSPSTTAEQDVKSSLTADSNAKPLTNPYASASSVDRIPQIEKQAGTDSRAKASSPSSNTSSNTNTRAQTSNINLQAQPNKPQTPPVSPTNFSAPTAPRATATDNPIQITNSPNKLVSAKTAPQEYKLDELLVALNKLSHFTTQYLGKVVVKNYWKSSLPISAWLDEFQVDRDGKIVHPKQSEIICSLDQIQEIRLWVSAYIKRCKQVIRNFDQMLEQDCLDSHQRQMLLSS
ncbi:hypothetical protein [Pseudanabaena sp. 'Roaring Creek']|uniref:hypothetical protein n=1 Tax=Pseudanabaena sp. 'Roaring Creek' TaxID=1681830 RepID=UPI0006D828D0|nr:hypothetical protein [Pseudanabaena sp. 'Roaring Creek']